MVNVKDTDIAWLAGIVNGEGCFSVKMPVKRGRGRSCHQVWLVICNTSKAMIDRAANIMVGLGTARPSVRRVWKGERATRWQYWVNLCQKDDLLLVTESLLPYLTAKRIEAEVIAWFLRRACRHQAYKRTMLDIAVLESLSAVKRAGGEAPAELRKLLSEVIPSEALYGTSEAKDERRERVETRGLRPDNNNPHERPAPKLGDEIVRHSEETRRAGINSPRN